MSYAFRFPPDPTPVVELKGERRWNRLSAARYRIAPGRHPGRPRPQHRIVFYLTEQVDTECSYADLRQRRVQLSSEFDIVPAGAEGYCQYAGSMELASIRLAPQLLTEAAEALEVRGPVALAARLGARDRLTEHLLRAVVAELEAPAPLGRLYADSLATALATRLIQGFCGAPAPLRQTLSKPRLRRIIEFVEAQLADDLTLPQIAEAAEMSVAHMTTLFRRTMGQSVHDYVVERRVQRARTLLLQRELSIAEVAAAAGFAHRSHMAKQMRRVLGVTPGQVRRT